MMALYSEVRGDKEKATLFVDKVTAEKERFSKCTSVSSCILYGNFHKTTGISKIIQHFSRHLGRGGDDVFFLFL